MTKANDALKDPPNGPFQVSFSGAAGVVSAGPWPGVGCCGAVCASVALATQRLAAVDSRAEVMRFMLRFPFSVAEKFPVGAGEVHATGLSFP